MVSVPSGDETEDDIFYFYRCVLGEMFFRKPILPGHTDMDQLDRIWNICGSPNQQNWPDYDKLPSCEGSVMGQIRFQPQERRIKQVYES